MFRSICSALPPFLAGFMPRTPRTFTELESIWRKAISTTWQLQWGQEFSWCTYLTIVLRNQGRLTMEGTASSISGCVLMKFRVSSGNSLDVTYFSNDVEPAQQPGLYKTREKGQKTYLTLRASFLFWWSPHWKLMCFTGVRLGGGSSSVTDLFSPSREVKLLLYPPFQRTSCVTKEHKVIFSSGVLHTEFVIYPLIWNVITACVHLAWCFPLAQVFSDL